MTEEELRLLDAEVAVKVMGWTNIKYRRGIDDWIGDEPDEIYDRTQQIVPNYSTEIFAAWRVVEKMRERVRMEVQFELFAIEDGSWEAVFGINGEGTGKSAPLAICRAALAAVGDRKR